MTVTAVYSVEPIERDAAMALVVEHHYLHRRPPCSFAFGLRDAGTRMIRGVLTLGVPASRHLQIGACPTDPGLVLELNRLWVVDEAPRNTETWFVARALKLLPPRIIVSYADTTRAHFGYVYRAANFFYAGWTDMERKTPRYDYIVEGSHTRQAFRDGVPQYTKRVRRQPKAKYWCVTGTRRDQRHLRHLMQWPTLDWHTQRVPGETFRSPQEIEAARNARVVTQLSPSEKSA